MPRTKPGHQDRKRPRIEPDSEVVKELRSACKAKDFSRVRGVLNESAVTAADATSCLKETRKNLPLMRLLLEHGADPSVCASTWYMKESFDLVKLLVEFGHDIKINGHCILQ